MIRHYDVICLGEAKLDGFMTIHDTSEKVHVNKDSGELCFKHGEKINVEKYDFQMGGNAANVAVGLTRLGIKATIICEMGDDEFSLKIRNAFAMENIERVLMVQKKEQTNFSVIINFQQERTIFSEHREHENDFEFNEVSSKWIYLTSLSRKWEAAYKRAFDFALGKHCKIAFNPGHFQLQEGKKIIHEILKITEILFVNKEEAELILFNHYNKKIDNSDNYIKNLCEELSLLGPKMVVLTNGKHGSYSLDSQNNFLEQGLIPGKIVERTGAGDAYASGFMGAIINGKTIEEAMKWGTHNAASVVGQVGAEPGLLKKSEMVRIL